MCHKGVCASECLSDSDAVKLSLPEVQSEKGPSRLSGPAKSGLLL